MIKVLFLILLSIHLAELNGAERVLIDPSIDPLSNEMVNTINSLNTTWKAKRNFVGISLDYFKGLLGVDPNDAPLPRKDVEDAYYIPESFDSREAWPNCSSVSFIRDQGACGSCWAFGAVEAMSDRICIKSGGQLQVDLSAQDLLTCCERCSKGCLSGLTLLAWQHWVSQGIVTGGYENKGCRPYKYAPCKHTTGLTLANCSGPVPEDLKCEKTCQPGYDKSYEEDKYYGAQVYGVGPAKKIQSEIMENGPVEAIMTIYSDFPSYSSGVYQKHSTKIYGAHAIRILGWGVENGIDYWLCANSWNTYWGDEGYFKILRGVDECGIESQVQAGIPKL